MRYFRFLCSDHILSPTPPKNIQLPITRGSRKAIRRQSNPWTAPLCESAFSPDQLDSETLETESEGGKMQATDPHVNPTNSLGKQRAQPGRLSCSELVNY